MAVLQDLLNDVNARYRNTFSTAQIVSWMNQVQNEIYKAVRHEALPYYFTLVSGNAFYPLPDDCDVKNLERVTIQDNNTGTDADYIELPFRRKSDSVGVSDQFYTIVDRNLFIYPVPDSTTAGLNVYLFYAKNPVALNSNNLSMTVDLDDMWSEVLVLGTLERIAAARKDVQMKNNYAADYQAMIDDYEFMNKMTDPEFVGPVDTLPKTRRSGYLGYSLDVVAY